MTPSPCPARCRTRRWSLPAAPAPVPPLEPGSPPIALLIDYDGTIAQTDVSDTLMAEFVTADWESYVAAYDEGIVGSRKLMHWEVGLITADPAQLRAKAAAQPHDPGFVRVRRGRARRPGSRSRSCRTGSASSSSRRWRRSGSRGSRW